MGVYLNVVKYEGPQIRVSDELDNFLIEHCANYGDPGVSHVNFDELSEALGLGCKSELMGYSGIPDDFKKLIKDRLDQEDIIFTVG